MFKQHIRNLFSPANIYLKRSIETEIHYVTHKLTVTNRLSEI